MFSQMPSCFDETFSKYQYDFRKGYNVEKWKTAVDEGKVFGLC